MRMRRGDEGLRGKLRRGGVDWRVCLRRCRLIDLSRYVVAPAVFGVEGSGVAATMGYALT